MRNPPREMIDITPPISEKLAVWPGDRPFGRETSRSFSKGDSFTLSSISTTVHLGAHADAPLHYHPEGEAIHTRDLFPYMGPCLVAQVKLPRGARILPEHLPDGLLDTPPPRVLFKTESFPDPLHWNDDFNALSPELIESLARAGVILVGLDTPSIDLAFDEKLISHTAAYRHNMSILEGLALGHVPPGNYELVALPLPIEGGDASPVRAVLVL